jgi:DNA-3-methyladenine glycosylase
MRAAAAAEAIEPLLPIRRLSRDELPVDTAALARFLVGKTLVHELSGAPLSGRIVETEAYVPGDAASHCFRGMTARNRAMFGERGHAYVYLSHGVWPCMNVVGETPGIGAGVLLRALEPLEGIAEMQRNRGTERLLDLARGPGRLATAMGVTLALNGVDLCGGGSLWLGVLPGRPAEVGTTTRIGISKEAHRPLRFFERGSPFVSGPRRLLNP